MAVTAIDTSLKDDLRTFRKKIAAGCKTEIEARTVGSLAGRILSEFESADKKEAQSFIEQYVSLLRHVAPDRRLRQGMAATLAPMATRLGAMVGDDAAIHQNHRHLVHILKQVAPIELSKAIPKAALAEARGNIQWYAGFDFATDSWTKLLAAFDKAIQPNGPWRTAMAHATQGPRPEGVRHEKIAAPVTPAAPAPGIPHVYFKGRMESTADVETRLRKCLADPGRLPEAVQVTALVASHPILRLGLAKHKDKLARRLFRAVRKNAQNSVLLARFTESMGTEALAGVPRRKLKAVMAGMPDDHAARCGRNIAAEKAPATVKHALIKADAQTAAVRARTTLNAAKPSEGYRRVIDQINALTDPRARRLAVEPLLRPLVAAIFNAARRDESALLYFDRLIPMAGGAIREAGLTDGQVKQYTAFASGTGLTKSLKTLTYHLSVRPAPSFAAAIPMALMARPPAVNAAARVMA